MSNPKIEKAPPIAERPKCRYCKKTLLPNFKAEKDWHTRRDDSKKRRVYELRETNEYGHATHSKRPVAEDDYGAIWDEKTSRWYVEREIQSTVSRKFLGTYGRYGDSLFCGLNCGYKWAVKMARKFK